MRQPSVELAVGESIVIDGRLLTIIEITSREVVIAIEDLDPPLSAADQAVQVTAPAVPR